MKKNLLIVASLCCSLSAVAQTERTVKETRIQGNFPTLVGAMSEQINAKPLIDIGTTTGNTMLQTNRTTQQEGISSTIKESAIRDPQKQDEIKLQDRKTDKK